tara:strand:+ start:721 stop:1413 length:693 start_codon:yes stop_codon:yes gene_type:complete
MKSVLVTGSSKGIGRHISEHYLGEGLTVFGCSRSDSDLKHKNYKHFICDVSDHKSVSEVISKIKKEGSVIDILINNAGIASLNHSILTPPKTLKKVFETNFYGSFFFAKECSKLMLKQKRGRIINFSTVAVPLNLEGELVYASSKSAIEKMTKILAKELSTYNITVNAVGPTPIKTDLTRAVPKQKLDELINMQAIKRFGEMDDVVNVIDFFIDERSDFITGQIVYLGGL